MSKIYTVFRLSFNSALHIGQGRNYYDTLITELSSDRLSSAIASIRAQLGQSDDLEEFLNSFLISTALPYIESDSGVEYYLPLPKGEKSIFDKNKNKKEYEYRKQIKKLRYAELSLWIKYISGEELNVSDDQLNGQFLTQPRHDFRAPYTSETKQRVVVDRDGGDAVPFFFDWMYFRENSGLYCILNSDAKSNLVDEIEYYLQILGETGIGSDKSVGGGQFEVNRAQIELSDVSTPNALLSLSTYIPTTDEIPLLNLHDAHYSLELRGGFMAGAEDPGNRHLVKKSIYSFATGSSFPITEKCGGKVVTGKVVDLKPSWNAPMHPVFRSGRALFIPIKTHPKA